MRISQLIVGTIFAAGACVIVARELLPSVRASVSPAFGSPTTDETIAPRFQDDVDTASDRLQRFDAETRLYRDPDAEVVIPGFGYGSPRAVRAQLQAQLAAARRDLVQELSRSGRTPPMGTAQLQVPLHSR
jgi:hypothetical protein